MARLDLALGRAPRAQPPFNRGDVAVAPPEQGRRVDAIESVVERDDVAQVRPRLPVGREAHDLPLITVSLEAEVFSESRVEKPQRVRPRNREHVVETPIVTIPDRRGLPGAPTVQHEHRSLLKTRKGISADGMGQMMVHKTNLCLGWPKVVGKAVRPASLMPHADKISDGVYDVQITGGMPSASKALKVVQEALVGLLPTETDSLQVF